MKKSQKASEVRNRGTFLRVYEIDALLRAGKCPNATALAKRFEVTRATISRDIDFMRDSMGLPVEYDRPRRCYHYIKLPPPLPEQKFTEGDLFGFCVMEQLLTLFRGTELETQLRSTFEKLAAGLTEKLSVSWEAVAEAVSVRPTSMTPPVAPEIFDTLRKASTNHTEVEFLYTGLNNPAPELRRVEPFHLMLRDGFWYVFAYDPERGEVRNFCLLRLEQLRTTGRHFEKSERHTHPDVRLQHSIGIFSGDKPERVCLRLNQLGARLLSERRYHSTQQITRHPAGHHELTMNVHITPELERWVMGYWQEVEVLEPRSLREQIQANARHILGWK